MSADEKQCPNCAETVKAAAKVCRHCGYDFDKNVNPATKKGKRSALGCLLLIIILGVFSTCAMKLVQPGSDLASTPFGVDGQLDKIHEKVATDAVAQYEIATQSGEPMDRCVQAGMVAAAFLQAQNQDSYAAWKLKEKADCRAAGLRR